MERNSSFGDRLKEYMVAKNNMTFEDLAKATGVPAQTLNRYTLNQRVPKIDIAADIAIKLNVNPLWLQGYNVGMYDEIGDVAPQEALLNDLKKLNIIPDGKELRKDEIKKLKTIISVLFEEQ